MSSNGDIAPEPEIQELEVFPIETEEFLAEQQRLAEEAETRRLEVEKEIAEREEANQRAEIEHLEANQADHEKRLRAAKAFDWDAWETETGLTRPEEVK